jgi:hypothetical protein
VMTSGVGGSSTDMAITCDGTARVRVIERKSKTHGCQFPQSKRVVHARFGR